MTHKQSSSQSARLYERALKVMPGGCSRNTVLRKPHPLYAMHGEGCYLTDIEGVRRIDFANNMASLIHGHALPAIVDAVSKQLQMGTGYTMATEVEVLFAEHLCSRAPSFDKIRFVNSGTEAVMSAVKASRAFTGRAKIAKIEGAYHGQYDYAEVSQNAGPANWGEVDRPSSVPVVHGTPPSALADVIVIPFNDTDRAIAILERNAADLACVLIDLMPHRIGLIPAQTDYVRKLREWTADNDVLLVCDEVITLRCHYGGAQATYDIEPDLTAMGKMIGGGFPVGALAGSDAVMSVMDPLADKVLFPHAGTFSANPVTMTAGRIAMELFDAPAIDRLNELGEQARAAITQAIEAADVPACVTGAASMFRIHMKPIPPVNYREAYDLAGEAALRESFLDYALANGIFLVGTCTGMLSTAMTAKEIDRLAEVVEGAFRSIKPALQAAENNRKV
ncbi:MAG: aspartate aminotransferase family protein [Proteobacteria bacterium]|nr:aspartate aminotransferase family protein [Pseudomonadota bacterium]